METEEKIDISYKQGFEHGYWLVKGDNKKVNDILKDDKASPSYKKGFDAGRVQAFREQAKAKIADLKNQKDLNRDREREKE